MTKIAELLFANFPGIATAFFMLIGFGTWAVLMLVGWRGEKRSFSGLLNLMSNDNGRAFRWDVNDVHIEPDAKRLSECRGEWEKRIERVRNDNADLLTVDFGPICKHMSDEYADMWLSFVRDILTNGGLVLKMILPLIPAYEHLTQLIKHEIAEAVKRDKRKSIPIILVIEEKDKLHELKSLENILLKEK